MVVDQLAEIGCDVVGPAYTISEARRLALAAAFDAAIIDWNMRGTLSSEIAEILSRRQIPFLFVTGYDDLSFEAHTNAVLNKPYTREALKNAVHNLLGDQKGSQQATTASKLQKLDDASASGHPSGFDGRVEPSGRTGSDASPSAVHAARSEDALLDRGRPLRPHRPRAPSPHSRRTRKSKPRKRRCRPPPLPR